MALRYNPFTTQFDVVLKKTTPAGNDTEIQFNNAGAFGASSNLKFESDILKILGGLAVGTSTLARQVTIEGNQTSGVENFGIVVRNTNSTGYSELAFNNDTVTSGGAFVFGYGGSASANSNEAYFNQRRNASLLFATSNLTRMRITGGGNVGIGENNPVAKLVISDSIASNQVGVSVNNTNSTGYAVFRIGTASASPIGVGIHHFNASYSGVGSYTPLTSTISGFESGGLKLHANNAAGAIRFYTAGSATTNERMVISSAGLVGIGTTTPVSKLTITDQVTADTRGLTINQNTTDAAAALSIFRKSRGTETSPLTVSNGDYTGAFSFRPYVSTSGYIDTAGFGARVNGTVTGTTAPADLYFYTSNTNQTNPYSDGTVRMVINSTGNVGIGTISPSTKLHVYSTVVGNVFSAQNFQSASAGGELTFTVDNAGRTAINVVATNYTIRGGAYFNATGFEESWFMVETLGNSANNKVMRFGNSRNGVFDTTNGTFAIQKLNDLKTLVSTTPFQISNAAPNESFILNSLGRIGIGTGATIGARMHIISTTEQLRAGYDASNYFKVTTTSTGYSQLDSIGSSAGIRLSASGSMIANFTNSNISFFRNAYFSDYFLNFSNPIDNVNMKLETPQYSNAGYLTSEAHLYLHAGTNQSNGTRNIEIKTLEQTSGDNGGSIVLKAGDVSTSSYSPGALSIDAGIDISNANNTASVNIQTGTGGATIFGGGIQLGDYSIIPSAPQGMIAYDYTNNYPVFYDGSNWWQI